MLFDIEASIAGNKERRENRCVPDYGLDPDNYIALRRNFVLRGQKHQGR